MVTTTLPTQTDTDLASIVRAYSDVTERLKQSHELLRREVCRLHDELHEKNKELARRERLAALGEMAAGVAHEIRNPLGGIGLYANLLEKDLSDRPEQAEVVRKIRVGVRNLESIVGDILAFAGGQEPCRHPASLGPILDDALTQVSPMAGARRITIEIDPSLQNQLIEVDARQIERALLNLLFNALDAVGQGGHVWVNAALPHSDDEFVHLSIEDDGAGLPNELLHRVFNPFFTTKENGTGLGLAIVHRIVESHGGRITAGNRPDGGAKFVLSLPKAMDRTAALVGG